MTDSFRPALPGASKWVNPLQAAARNRKQGGHMDGVNGVDMGQEEVERLLMDLESLGVNFDGS